jgi:hypothetical protein
MSFRRQRPQVIHFSQFLFRADHAADAQSPPLPILSTNLPGVGTALLDQPDAAIVPEFYLPHQVTHPIEDSSATTAFDFGRPDLTSARNNADVSGLDDQPFPRTLPFNPSFDAQYDFNFVSPPVMAADPLQNLIDAFGIYSTPFDDSYWLSSTPSGEESSSSPFSFPNAHPGNEEQPSLSIAKAVGVDSWPILPPPQPDSLPSPPMPNVSSAAIAAKARSHREPEVDVRNILPETSARSRAPTARKRNAEEAIEVRKSKKVKKVSEILLRMQPTLIPISTVVISRFFTSPYLLDCNESCSICLSIFIANLLALGA